MKFTFIETPTFTKRLFQIWDENEYLEFQELLLHDPQAGKVIVGSEGLRKIRYKTKGKGKSGGVRIIYFAALSRDIIVMLDVYSKSDKADLSKSELKELAREKRRVFEEE